MAKQVEKIIIGVDIAKDECVIHVWNTGQTLSIPNQAETIREWLSTFTGPVQLAVEPTAHYHLTLMTEALALDFEVYPVNPRQLVHYRQAVDIRNKTDPEDAYLLARYLAHEGDQLRPHRPQRKAAQELWALIKRRGLIVSSRKQLQQSTRHLSHLPIRDVLTEFGRLLDWIDRRAHELIASLGWLDDYQRCCSLPGIGPVNALALVAAYHRGVFAHCDAFIAFLGLDVRARESGTYKGKRKLTKRGESELRRLLYCAAQAARCYPPFEAYYQRQLDKGLSKTAAKVILSRKLARIAFALISNETMFEKRVNMA